MDLNMSKKIRPINLKCIPMLEIERVRTLNFYINNVLSRNHECPQQDPATEFNAVRENAITLPHVLGGSL
jgi:hypothetical protein